MRIIMLVLLIAVFGYAMALVLSNSEPLSVNLLFTQVPTMHAGLLLILCIGLGIILGLLIGLQLFRVFQLNWENSRLKKEIKTLRKEQVTLAAQAANKAAPTTASVVSTSNETSSASQDDTTASL